MLRHRREELWRMNEFSAALNLVLEGQGAAIRVKNGCAKPYGWNNLKPTLIFDGLYLKKMESILMKKQENCAVE